MVSQSALTAFTVFAVNPTAGLSAAFESLDKRRALEVGIVFAIVFDLCVIFGINKIVQEASTFLPALSESTGVLKLMILGIIPFACSVAASAAARKLFRGDGTIEGDAFIAGASLLPSGIFLLLAAILGMANIEIVLALFVFALCYTILIMHTGYTRISKIPEGGAALAVPIGLLLSAWLAKVVLTIV